MIPTAAALRQRFVAFVAERRPFAPSIALDMFDRVVDRVEDLGENDIEQAVRRLVY